MVSFWESFLLFRVPSSLPASLRWPPANFPCLCFFQPSFELLLTHDPKRLPMRNAGGLRPICRVHGERPSFRAFARNAPRRSRRGNCRIRKARLVGGEEGMGQGDGMDSTSGILGLRRASASSQNCAGWWRAPLTLLQASHHQGSFNVHSL